MCNAEIIFALVCVVDMNRKPHLCFCVAEVLQFFDLEAHRVLLYYKDPLGLNAAISLYAFTIGITVPCSAFFMVCLVMKSTQITITLGFLFLQVAN